MTIKRDRKDFDTEKYKSEIEKIDWTELLETENVDIVNDILVNKILEFLDKVAPVKKYQRRKKCRNWVEGELKVALEERDKLREAARVSGRMEDWAIYRVERNRCTKLIRKAKKEHHQNLFAQIQQENYTKKLYRLTKEVLDVQENCMPQQFLENGVLIRKPEQMANLQNYFYKKKIDDLVKNLRPPTGDPLSYLKNAIEKWEEKDRVPEFNFREITMEETFSLISSLGNSTAMGHKGLDALAIKSASKSLCRPIKHLINISLRTKKVVNLWKILKITPRLKSQELDRLSTSSFRPVAVLPVLSKLIERTAQQQLLGFLKRTKQLNSSNHVYRKNYGTTTTLSEVLD